MATLELTMDTKALARHLHAAMREWQFSHNGSPDSPVTWDRLRPDQLTFWCEYAALIIGQLAGHTTPQTKHPMPRGYSSLLNTRPFK